MRYNELTSGEKETLDHGFRNHPKFHVRKRFHAILLSAQEWQVKDIADLYHIRTRTIYTWFDNWRDYGIAGLFIQPGRGLKATLSINDKNVIENIKKKYSNTQEI